MSSHSGHQHGRTRETAFAQHVESIICAPERHRHDGGANRYVGRKLEECPRETLHVKDQLPAEGIIDTAKARGCDLIVMASHGRRDVARLLLGSQANKVVTHSTVPVLICW
jgi:nucleotide-binding universal stress UspA family protein